MYYKTICSKYELPTYIIKYIKLRVTRIIVVCGQGQSYTY